MHRTGIESTMFETILEGLEKRVNELLERIAKDLGVISERRIIDYLKVDAKALYDDIDSTPKLQARLKDIEEMEEDIIKSKSRARPEANDADTHSTDSDEQKMGTRQVPIRSPWTLILLTSLFLDQPSGVRRNLHP